MPRLQIAALPGLSWRAVEAVLSTILVGLSAPLYGRFFTGTQYLHDLVPAAVGGIALGAALMNRPARWAVPAAAIGLVVLLGYGPFRGDARLGLPTLPMIRDVALGLWHGVPRMLTVTLPADPRAQLVAVPIAVTALAAFAAAWCLGRRIVLLPLVPALVSFAVGLMLTASSAPPRTALTIGWLLAALFLTLVRTNRPAVERAGGVDRLPRERRSVARGVLLGLPAVVVVAVAAVVLAVALPIANSDHRFDPRKHITPPVRLNDQISPLSNLQGQLLGTPQRLFTVTFATARPPVDRIRLAALDSYDGSLWTVSGAFRQAGTTLPVVGNLQAPETDEIRVRQLAANPFGPFLAQIGQAAHVSGATADYEAATGTLLATGPLAPAFTLAAELSRPTNAQLAVSGPAPVGNRSLPAPVPPLLVTLASRLVSENDPPYLKLQKIARWVSALPYNPKGPPGDSYFSLLRLAGGTAGYAEQHAALFAVLARIEGMPARVAVGYLLDAKKRAGNTFTVTTRDATAWPEVDLAGYGWQTFDATDVSKTVANPPPLKPLPKSKDNGSQRRVTIGAPKRSSVLARAASPGIPLWLTALVSVLVAVVLLFGAIVGGRYFLRRRRRTTGTVPERVVGAWRTVLDTLLTAGVPTSRSLTGIELADQVDAVLGAEVSAPLRKFAPLLSTVLYSPDEPSADAATIAWAFADDIRRAVRSRLPWWRVGLVELDPRPLVRLPQGTALPTWRPRRPSLALAGRLRGRHA